MSSFAGSSEVSGTGAERIHQLNDELRETYKKLAESKESVVTLKERVTLLERENEKLKEDNKRLTNENDQRKTVINEMKEKVEIRTKEHAALKSENELLHGKIKELSSDNALYFKKIMDLQSQIVEKMNDANQLYEEAKSMRQDSILKKNNEVGISESGMNYGIDLSILNENYFNVPSKPRHKLFAHSKEAMC
jgi:autophagy-related protein 16